MRVCTADQNTERQQDANWSAWADIIDYLRDGDTSLTVRSMGRLARNTEDLLRLVREGTAKGTPLEINSN